MRDRFARWLNSVRSLLAPDESARLACLHPVAGDICQDNLGIDPARRRRPSLVPTSSFMPRRTQTFPPRRPRASARSMSMAPGGHLRGLRRAAAFGDLFLSAARSSQDRAPAASRRTATRTPPDFVTHYQRTKWEAEHLALDSGLPVGIARVSLVLGSHAAGSVHRPGAVHSLIKWFARGLIPMVPRLARSHRRRNRYGNRRSMPRARGDCGLGSTSPPPSGTSRPAKNAPRMSELIDFVYQHFADHPTWRHKRIPRARMVSEEEFARFIASVDASGHPTLAQALQSINRFLPDLPLPKNIRNHPGGISLGRAVAAVRLARNNDAGHPLLLSSRQVRG